MSRHRGVRRLDIDNSEFRGPVTGNNAVRRMGDVLVSRSQTSILFRSWNKMAVWLLETSDVWCELS